MLDCIVFLSTLRSDAIYLITRFIDSVRKLISLNISFLNYFNIMHTQYLYNKFILFWWLIFLFILLLSLNLCENLFHCYFVYNVLIIFLFRSQILFVSSTIVVLTPHVPVFFWHYRQKFRDIKLKFCIYCQLTSL